MVPSDDRSLVSPIKQPSSRSRGKKLASLLMRPWQVVEAEDGEELGPYLTPQQTQALVWVSFQEQWGVLEGLGRGMV